MTDTEVLSILRDAFMLAFKIAGPILITALLIGVVISLIQTVTQIQEMTLTFVPKLVGSGLVILLAGNWMIREMVFWVNQLWSTIPRML